MSTRYCFFDPDGTRGEKDEVIAYAMEQLAIADRDKVIMLGDRANDAWGAGRNGIGCLGALWGFEGREELLEAGVTELFETPLDVLNFFEN